MAIRASLMEKFLLKSEPLRLPGTALSSPTNPLPASFACFSDFGQANGPHSAETIESLPITSFDMLDEARRAQYREFETL